MRLFKHMRLWWQTACLGRSFAESLLSFRKPSVGPVTLILQTVTYYHCCDIQFRPRILFHQGSLSATLMCLYRSCQHEDGFMAFSQSLLYAHIPKYTGNDLSVQVCPLIVPQCHCHWLWFGFIWTTLYSNIQEPSLQWVVWSFYTFSQSLTFVPV